MNIIFIIVLIIVVVSIKNKSRQTEQHKQMPNLTVSTADRKTHNAGSTSPYGNAPVSRMKTEKMNSVKNTSKASMDGSQEQSTTQYLAEKAEEDAREHAKEKLEEQRRLHETRGGFAVAERLYEGDPIPAGKRCVVCGYCAAENLVPLTLSRKYSCYFCRELLKD